MDMEITMTRSLIAAIGLLMLFLVIMIVNYNAVKRDNQRLNADLVVAKMAADENAKALKLQTEHVQNVNESLWIMHQKDAAFEGYKKRLQKADAYEKKHDKAYSDFGNVVLPDATLRLLDEARADTSVQDSAVDTPGSTVDR